MTTKDKPEEIGLAVVGCGVVGRIRAVLASHHPGVGWLGVCDINEELAKQLADDVGADFYTTDHEELLARPEVTATIIATDAQNHFRPTMTAVEQGHDMLVEKPLAVKASESLEVYQAIRESGVDAVLGYTQRFRRRFLTIKERLNTGQLGEVEAVTTRALLNRMMPYANVPRDDPNVRRNWTPMVISGTHAVDISLWFMEGKEPVEVYARSNDKVLGEIGVNDSTFSLVTMDDGTIWSMNVSCAMPEVWPGAVYGLDVAVLGTKGAITIDDTHRDLVVASSKPLGTAYRPGGYEGVPRHVEFLTSFPPGDEYDGQLWGPMRDETNAWLGRVHSGLETPHTPASEGHRNLVLTMAMDLSAERGVPVKLPVDLDEFDRPQDL